MSTAGSGDVLTGMIAAFLGQGLDAFNAAKYAVYLHGLAGDLAAKKKTQMGMVASDIIDEIPAAIKRCS
jgi:NAD(P)H-hydrate epimerase